MASGWSPCGSKEETSLNLLMSERPGVASFWFLVSGFWFQIAPRANQKPETRNQKCPAARVSSLPVNLPQCLGHRLRLLRRDLLVHARVAHLLEERLQPGHLRLPAAHACDQRRELLVERRSLRGRDVLRELAVDLALHVA